MPRARQSASNNQPSRTVHAERIRSADDFSYRLAAAWLAERRLTVTESEYKRLSGLIRARRYDLLSSIDDVGDVQSTASRVTTLRQLRAFFSKNAQFANARKCEQAAIDAFERGEAACRRTNRRLAHYAHHPDRLPLGRRYQLAIFRKKFQEVLGDVAAFLDSIPQNLRLTSGATEATTRNRSVPFMKLKGYARLPERSLPFLGALQVYHDLPDIRVFPVDYNRVAFVAKSWKTHRTIACEPAALLPFQLCFDLWIKARLLAVFGIDLRSQRRNQEHAYLGSVHDDNATVDLRGASDTLALALVRLNAGAGWWDVLRRLRVAGYTMRTASGKVCRGEYSKFSSMGNGATFGLETAIFASACYACGVDLPIVYGDDIIVPRDKASYVIDLLKFLGFRTNVDKTFVSGPFRESCGEDYWRGVRVTPVYLRGSVIDRPTRHLIWNGMMERCLPNGPVADFLLSSRRTLPIILVPYGTDETTGVWISPAAAWDAGILKWPKKPRDESQPWYQVGTFRGVTVKSHSVSACRSSRALEMWHLEAAKGREMVLQHPVAIDAFGPRYCWEPVIASSYSGTVESTTISRRTWSPPLTAVPSHIYVWEGELLRAS